MDVSKIDNLFNDNHNLNANCTLKNFKNRACVHVEWSSNCTVPFVYVCVHLILDINRD